MGLSTDIEALSAPSSPSQAAATPLPAECLTHFQRDAGGLRATTIAGPSLYFIAIIDVLQSYDVTKRVERCWKVYGRCKRGDGISAIDPQRYRARFLRAMESVTEEEQAAVWAGQASSPVPPIVRVDGGSQAGDDDDAKDDESKAAGKDAEDANVRHVQVTMLKEALLAHDHKEEVQSTSDEDESDEDEGEDGDEDEDEEEDAI